MRKKIIYRAILGALIGFSLSTMITIIISLTMNDGNYYAVVPKLIEDCGNEMNAVLFQAILSIFYGAAFGTSGLIWEIDNWSILKQTVAHFFACSIATLPIAYFCRWMSHDVLGIIRYFAIFIAIYIIIWLSQYSSMKKRINEINNKLSNSDQQ